MSALGITRRAQRRTQAHAIETLRVDRVIGTTSDEYGNAVPELLAPPVYVGPGKIQTYEPHESQYEVAGGTAVEQRYSIHIPVNEGPFQVGDFITRITEGKPERVFRVAGTHDKTYQSMQRLLCDEQTGGIQ